MIYGELGRYLLEFQVKTRIIAYWSKLLTKKETILFHLFYSFAIQLNQEIGKIYFFDCIRATRNHF